MEAVSRAVLRLVSLRVHPSHHDAACHPTHHMPVIIHHPQQQQQHGRRVTELLVTTTNTRGPPTGRQSSPHDLECPVSSLHLSHMRLFTHGFITLALSHLALNTLASHCGCESMNSSPSTSQEIGWQVRLWQVLCQSIIQSVSDHV